MIQYIGKIILVIQYILLIGCSGANAPFNPEPSIRISDVIGISRTQATISLSITNESQSRLEYVTLSYGTGDTENDMQVIDCTTDKDELSIKLENLTPGTTYTCHATCGTSTAKIKSNSVNFTTVPNNRPSLAPLKILSAGPIGMIVEIKITDDGGETVTSLGCEVLEEKSGKSWTVNLNDDNLTLSTHKLSINGLSVNTAYTITPFAKNSTGDTVGEPLSYTTPESVLLSEPGQLSQLLTLMPGTILPEPLVIAGSLNGDDFRFLRTLIGVSTDMTDMARFVTSLDLTDVLIREGGGTYDGSRYVVSDVITNGLFADCVALKDILLPASAKKLERDALCNCVSLKSLTIPAGIEDLLPSSGCPAIQSIEVSSANDCYASVDGVLFNHDVSDIVWFPPGKTGAYALPPTVTTISEAAFSHTSISSIIIPESVKTIGRGAFANSALTEITLPDNISRISVGMFQNSAELTTLRLGSGTAIIDAYAFYGAALTDLYIRATIPPTVNKDAFANVQDPITKTCTLHVPSGSKRIYQNHQSWGQFENIEEF